MATSTALSRERSRPAAAARPAARSFVVTYHYVRERNSDGVVGVTPDEFRRQCRALADRYRVVTAEEYVERHARTADIALITFDDAVVDQWRAAEILDELGLPAVFFAPMRPYSPETDRWCTQHLLHALAQELGWAELAARVEPHFAGLAMDACEAERLYHYEAPQKRRIKYALGFALPPARVAAILREINAPLGLSAGDWYLSAAQLQALQDAGHSLGGHGFDHVPYSTLTPRQQVADMHRAAALMNRLFGALPRTIAYPYGRYTAETDALARGCGYTLALTTENRVDARDFWDELKRRSRH